MIDEKCALCKTAFDLEARITARKAGKKFQILYEDWQFVMVICVTCKAPILILKNHIAADKEIDKARIAEIFAKAVKVAPTTMTIDYDLKENPKHWHCHYRKKK